MENIKLTEAELQYINDDTFNNQNDVYRTILIGGQYYIYATLPTGWYKFKVPENEKLSCFELLRQDGIHANIDYSGIVIHLNNTKTAHILVTSNSAEIVKSLREQAIINRKNLQQSQEHLIAKDIKRHKTYLAIDKIGHQSDLGKSFNSASLMDTIKECLDEDITIELDETKSMDDLDVRYLHAMKLIQDKKRLDAKQHALDKEKQELKQREIEFIKY